MVEIIEPHQGTVYDPACGSGGMLISSYQHVEDSLGRKDADKLFLFGQEANHKTLALAKMNLYIHDIRNAQIILGDTLLYPKFKASPESREARDRRNMEGIKNFNVVIANPPWNQDGYDDEILKKGEFWRERFKYGFTPRQSADWAWIEHMLASADDKTGRVGVVIDNGCLFRSGKEKAIRTGIINADLLDAVILLPEKLFYNTGAPGAIIVLNKNKPQKRKRKIFFINASKEYQQHPEVRKLNQLGQEHIAKIVRAYREFRLRRVFPRLLRSRRSKKMITTSM
jgi:type I restriction enzyme M protein